MEKKRPTYDLSSIKQAFSNPGNIDITMAALNGARELGFGIEDMLNVLQAIEKKDFIKSMTSHANHKVWQDVYNVPWDNIILYIKFTAGRITRFRLLSFKEV